MPIVPVSLTPKRPASLLAVLSSQAKTKPLVFATAMLDASPNPMDIASDSKRVFSYSY
ncbi:MAG: hypothetical protein HY806_04525 [Nitrospirae bacterium]|nr:hypothetical protein [Nitrospirota bacterium]